jgi:hypothetical protein
MGQRGGVWRVTASRVREKKNMPKQKRAKRGKWIKADAVRLVKNPGGYGLEIKRMTKKPRKRAKAKKQR